MSYMSTHIRNAEGEETLTIYDTETSETLCVTDEHPHFEAIVLSVESEAPYSELRDLADVSAAVGRHLTPLSERVAVSAGRVFFDGDPLDGAIGEHIGRLLDAGDDRGWRALVAFLEKVMANPSEHSRTQLYDWLRGRPFSITEEGDLVAYKGVESDGAGGYQSLHVGPAYRNGEWLGNSKVPNAVGDVIELPRSEVTADSFVGCASGLHAGTYNYAEGYSRNGAMLKVLINPRDVVSVPTDSSAQKVRVCRYKVEAIIDAPEADPVVFTDVPEDEPEDEPVAEAIYVFEGVPHRKSGEVRDPRKGEVFLARYFPDGTALRAPCDEVGYPREILLPVEDDE